MDVNLVQSMIDIVFKGNLLYLSPILFLLMVILFADRLIDLVMNSFGRTSKREYY